MFTIRGCSPKRGEIYVHAHMCMKYNVHILKLTSHISLTFDSWISLNFSSKFKFFRFADMLTKTRCAHYDCNLQTHWNLAISLKHWSHGWETNRTSAINLVHGTLRSLATMDLHLARCEARPSPAYEPAVPCIREYS